MQRSPRAPGENRCWVKAGLIDPPAPWGRIPPLSLGRSHCPSLRTLRGPFTPKALPRGCSGSSLPGSTRSLAHTHGSPAGHKKTLGRGPQCPPPPSPAPHAPHCPRRSGLKRGLLPLVGGGALGLQRAPGPPAVRAGLPSRGGAHFPGPGGDTRSAVLSRAKPRASQRPVPPALQRLTQHGLVVANPSEPSTSSTTRGRTLADRVPSTLVASKRKKETGF